MNNVLIAKSTDTGFAKVKVIKVRADGGFSLGSFYAGSLESAMWRDGVAQLLSDTAIMSVDCQFGTSPTYRLSRA